MYIDPSLSPGDSVQYRLAAINAIGQAPYSNIPPAVTTTDPTTDDILAQILADIAELFALVLGLQSQIAETDTSVQTIISANSHCAYGYTYSHKDS